MGEKSYFFVQASTPTSTVRGLVLAQDYTEALYLFLQEKDGISFKDITIDFVCVENELLYTGKEYVEEEE